MLARRMPIPVLRPGRGAGDQIVMWNGGKMNKYVKNSGSEWNRWDLHIHTPETNKNDTFKGSTIDEKWQNYLDELRKSDKNIKVIGITDYFSVENYFKFKGYYLSDEKLNKKYSLILPNVELRITPVTKSGTPINIHCIFNPDIDDQIQTRFLSKLTFRSNDSDYSAIKSEVIRLGRDFTSNPKLDEFEAYKAGIEQFVISFDSLVQLFKNDKGLRNNTIIVASNKSNDGVSGLRNHSDYFIGDNFSQLEGTRRAIYQFTDAIFSSNINDRNYFLGKGPDDKKEVLRKCKSLKPCFHGSDAHSLDKIFLPDGDRYCWIKGTTDFIGLKQTLYEPGERVIIQSNSPDLKNPFNIIKSVNFDCKDEIFGKKVIYFNQNLNSIIGGKSSGKSLLLNTIAKTIDINQVGRLSDKLESEDYSFPDTFHFSVKWENGDEDIYSLDEFDDWDNNDKKRHRITYIPQLYINYLAEKNNKSVLNELIESILSQNDDYKKFSNEVLNDIKVISSQIQETLDELLDLRSKGLETNQKIKSFGSKESLVGLIKQLEAQIRQKQKSSNLSPEQIQTQQKLLEEKESLSNKKIEINKIIDASTSIMDKIKEVTNSLIRKDYSSLEGKGFLYRIIDDNSINSDDIKRIIDEYSKRMKETNTYLYESIKALELQKEIDKIDARISKINEELKPFYEKTEEREAVKSLIEKLEIEKGNLQNLNKLAESIKIIRDNFKQCKNIITQQISNRITKYFNLINEINEKYSDIGEGIVLSASFKYELENFGILDKVDKRSAFSNDHFKKLIEDDHVEFNHISEFFSSILRINDGSICFADENISPIPLRARVEIDEIYRDLIEDNIIFDFNIKYKDDDLLKMSPGKKGTVLLILFLQLSTAEHPILIDQPEDNLDNRTIYDLLCQIIREKKKDRQIVIVSHNANLVVSTDSENIIVANQRGQEPQETDSKTRFEYCNGPIELSFSYVNVKDSNVRKQGIKEHVCDILEGGDTAFKQRELRYNFENFT